MHRLMKKRVRPSHAHTHTHTHTHTLTHTSSHAHARREGRAEFKTHPIAKRFQHHACCSLFPLPQYMVLLFHHSLSHTHTHTHTHTLTHTHTTPSLLFQSRFLFFSCVSIPLFDEEKEHATACVVFFVCVRVCFVSFFFFSSFSSSSPRFTQQHASRQRMRACVAQASEKQKK